MKHLFASGAVAAVAAFAALASGPAQAQSAGNWLVSVGGNNIDPQVDSGNLSASSLPNSKIDVKDASSVIGMIAYMVTDNLSVETYIAYPYKHDVIGAGALDGVGKIGSVKQVSPTVMAQWRFGQASSPFRPYVGAGPTYAYFFKEEGSGTLTALTNPGGSPTKLSVENAWGFSLQVGATYAFNDRWFANASVIKTFIKTSNTLSTGQTLDVKLDPLVIGATVGYRF